jgi:hypothetical protein
MPTFIVLSPFVVERVVVRGCWFGLDGRLGLIKK